MDSSTAQAIHRERKAAISRVGQWGPLFVRVTMTYIVAGLAAYAGVMALRRDDRARIARA